MIVMDYNLIFFVPLYFERKDFDEQKELGS